MFWRTRGRNRQDAATEKDRIAEEKKDHDLAIEALLRSSSQVICAALFARTSSGKLAFEPFSGAVTVDFEIHSSKPELGTDFLMNIKIKRFSNVRMR